MPTQTYTREKNPATGEADLAFAQKFHAWNGASRGVVRVDGAREEGGEGRLLLMEIEDYNPYLSLDLLDEVEREAFVGVLASSIRQEL